MPASGGPYEQAHQHAHEVAEKDRQYQQIQEDVKNGIIPSLQEYIHRHTNGRTLTAGVVSSLARAWFHDYGHHASEEQRRDALGRFA